MDKTTIEHFNNYLKLFVADIKSLFPDYCENLDAYYSDLLESDVSNDDKYVKRFIKKTQDFSEMIKSRNEELFSSDIFIIKTVNFSELWKKDISKSNREKIWEYIQTLYVLGETIISDTEKVKKLVENIKNINSGQETQNDDTELLDVIKKLSKDKETLKNSNIDDDFINNSLIGNLAKELSDEINIDNMNINENMENVDDIFSNLLSGDNPMKFMNLVQSVGEKINNKVNSGNLDQEKLISEAGQMMGALGENNPLFSNLFKNMSNSETTEKPSNPTHERLKKKLEQRNKKV